MSFATSQISFGSYVFPSGFKLSTRTNDTNIDEVQIPFQNGTHIPPGYRNSLVIQVDGTIGGAGAVDSLGNYITNRTQCEAEVQLMRQYLIAGYQPFSYGLGQGGGSGATAVRTISAQLTKFSVTYGEANNAAVAVVAIQFTAPNPSWYAATTKSLTLSGTGTQTGTATSAGSDTSYPIFTLTGTGVNPAVKIAPNGYSGYIEVSMTRTMTGSDTIVVNCDPRNRANGILLNGTPTLSLAGTAGFINTLGTADFFPFITPGANTVSVISTSGSVSCTVTWQDTYIG